MNSPINREIIAHRHVSALLSVLFIATVIAGSVDAQVRKHKSNRVIIPVSDLQDKTQGMFTLRKAASPDGRYQAVNAIGVDDFELRIYSERALVSSKASQKQNQSKVRGSLQCNTEISPQQFVWIPGHGHMLIFCCENYTNNYAGLFVWNGGKRFRTVLRSESETGDLYTITGISQDGAKVYFSHGYTTYSKREDTHYLCKYILDVRRMVTRQVSKPTKVKSLL
jgi:hypothetical protein